eukprot:TRINITY_DN10113_c1_g1_i2.p1 TRINITY_DN10113_c1_g1~~TRINITY_DN10113_c1_g1_i2.p1  ORF type:complete len:150 (+),score=41.97 TRINITY_DN10113_c1_g1_i2:56-505(+)
MADQQIGVGDLSLQELKQYLSALEEEIKQLSEHHGALKQGRERYQDSRATLEGLEECSSGEQMMIPLTQSMYVPGTLKETKQAIIEVGAGYYIKMSTEKAKDFMKRKMEGLTETMNKIEKAVQVKRQQAEVMQMTARQKMAASQPPPSK